MPNPKEALIMDALLKLINEQGYHSLAVPQIAREAGVATGTLYNYFESKAALLQALYAREKTRMGAALNAGDDPKATYPARFRGFLQRLFRYFVQHPASFLFLETYGESPLIPQTVRLAQRHHYQPATEFLAQGIELGFIRPADPALLTVIVYSNVVAAVRYHFGPDGPLSDAAQETCFSIAWEGVRA